MDWDKIRSNYPLIENETYFNSAYFGAMSKQTVSVQKAYLDKLHLTGSKYFDEWSKDTEYIKTIIGQETKATNYSIGLTTDVSTGMNLIANTLTGSEKVVLLEGDFPAVNVPWVIRGFDIHWIQRKGYAYSLEDIQKSLENGVKIVAVSWVMYNSGYVMDLKSLGELCKIYGAILMVDGTQGLGVLPIDLSVLNIDVFLASTFKWLLSGYGIAFAFISNDFEKKYPMHFAGQNSISRSHTGEKDLLNYKSGAERFEMGHLKSQQIESLKASISELNETGFEVIQQRTLALTLSLRSQLEDAGMKVLTPYPQQSSILIFEANESLYNKLSQANINCTFRDGYIRLAVYFYNNESDILHLINTIKT